MSVAPRVVLHLEHPTEEALISQASTQSAKQFNVHLGDAIEVVEGRARAVEIGKQQSSESFRRVRIERTDGAETMEFRSGGLESYKLSTGRRRR